MMPRAGAAERIAPLVEALLGAKLQLRLRAWDGTETGPVDSPATVVINTRRALRRAIWAPGELGLARAYVAGDIDIEGDLYAALTISALTAGRELHPGLRLPTREQLALAGAAARLGAIGPPPAPPPEEVRRLRGGVHSKSRDAAAISHHYDVGNDFYELFLGSSMTYSCAYWAKPAYELADAQRAKHDLIARKLGLRPGMRLLDVGCGWGSLVMHAAAEYGVNAVGVTISQQQAERARKRVADAGLADLVEIRLQDYRDVSDGPYDAISSVGMAEHVGHQRYAEYVADLFGLVRVGGRLLNHQITEARSPGGSRRTSFINRYVFPDGELLPLGTIVKSLEDGGFEVRDVEGLREHYALTLRAWVGNLEANWDEAVRLTSPGRARVWRLYMAGSALAFEAGRIGIHQVLAVRQGPRGESGLPKTREEWLTKVTG